MNKHDHNVIAAKHIVKTIWSNNEEWMKGIPASGISIAVALLEQGWTKEETRSLLTQYTYAVANEYGA